MRRKVNYVKLHSSDTFLPGIGSVGNTLPPSNKTLNGLSIYFDTDTSDVLFLEVSGREYILPMASVQVLALSSEDNSPVVVPITKAR